MVGCSVLGKGQIVAGSWHFVGGATRAIMQTLKRPLGSPPFE